MYPVYSCINSEAPIIWVLCLLFRCDSTYSCRLVGWLGTDTFRFPLCWCQSKENLLSTFFVILEWFHSARKSTKTFWAKLFDPKHIWLSHLLSLNVDGWVYNSTISYYQSRAKFQCFAKQLFGQSCSSCNDQKGKRTSCLFILAIIS